MSLPTAENSDSVSQPAAERFEGSWERPGKNLTAAAVLGLIIVGILYFYGLNIVAGIAVFTKGVGLPEKGSSFIQRMTSSIMRTKNPIRVSVTISEFIFMLLPTIWIVGRWHSKKVLSYIRFRRIPLVEIFLAIVTTIFFIPVSSFIGEFLMKELHFPDFLAQINDQIFTSYTPTELLWLVFVVCITPAICEETLFRGYFQRTLERNLGLKSVFIAGIIFGLYHMEPINLISLSLLGILFGYFYYRSKSIIPGMAAHFTNNLLAVLSLYRMSDDSPVVSFLSSETSVFVFLIGILLSGMLVVVYKEITARNFTAKPIIIETGS